MPEATTTAKGTTDAAATTPETTAAGKATPEPGAAAAAAEGSKPGAAEGAKPAAGTKGAEPPAGPPDKYALAISDAGKVHIDDSDLRAFEKMARETGWTNEEAQAAIDEHVRVVAEAAEGFLAQTKADPDYGGEHLPETQRLAKLGIDLLRPEGHTRRESFTRFLNKVGASNHIEVISFLADLGKRASEDAPGQTSSAQLRGQRSAEQVLYDKTPSS